MNTFRTMSRLLVVTAVVLAANVKAVDFDSIVNPILKIASNKNIQHIALGSATVAGGDVLKDLLKKESPIAVAGLAGLISGAIDNGKTGVVAAGTSLVISTLAAHTPEIAAVDAITGKLPKCLTSKEAKMAAQIAAAAVIAHYVVGAGNNNG